VVLTAEIFRLGEIRVPDVKYILLQAHRDHGNNRVPVMWNVRPLWVVQSPPTLLLYIEPSLQLRSDLGRGPLTASEPQRSKRVEWLNDKGSVSRTGSVIFEQLQCRG
jgi:hypothetical protein